MTAKRSTPKQPAAKQHFVTFFSPGTFMAEASEKPISSWNVAKAKEMARKIKERYGAEPYGFQFTTRSRGPKDLDSHQSAKSGIYYIKSRVKVETLAEIEARNLPAESILRSNMRGNGWDKVVTTTKGWKWTQPLNKGDEIV